MTIRLTAPEIQALTSTFSCLVAPLDYATLDHWRAAANDQMRALLNADSAGFLLTVPGEIPLFSREHDVEALARYTALKVPDLADGSSIWSRVMALRAGRLAEAYGDEYDRRYLASAYYNEYARPNGATDTIQMTTTLSADPADGVASAQLWHGADSRGARRFDDREVEMLRLLFPAFQAGVRTHFRWSHARGAFLGTLDAARTPALVFDASGREVHRSTALGALLAAAHDGGQRLSEELRRLAGDLCDVTRASGRDKASYASLGAPLEVERELGNARYRISVFRYDPDRAPDRALIVASVERMARDWTADSLRKRFRLTPAEADVALGLMRGWSNERIARERGVSQHTVRHQTESVLAKLGVSTRAAAIARLSSRNATDEP